jgi:predicted nucleotidyltransferase component of viral defense system
MIPIILRLRKANQKEIAKAQDLIVEALFRVFKNAVFHGGTAIWRCYQGNRFSEDVDVYIKKDIKKIEILFEEFKKIGFTIEKKKIGSNSLYSNLRINNTLVKFEAFFKEVNGTLKEYETAIGRFIPVSTLTPKELVKEKVNAYINRLKKRDLYDIFFLIKYVDDKNKIKDSLNKLLTKFKNPVDEKEFEGLIIEGLVPQTNQLINFIGRYA